MLLSIKNSKPSGTSSYQQTSKKDKIKHGGGIRSVRKVAEKYGGELLLKDQGEHFEAVLLLNGGCKTGVRLQLITANTQLVTDRLISVQKLLE